MERLKNATFELQYLFREAESVYRSLTAVFSIRINLVPRWVRRYRLQAGNDHIQSHWVRLSSYAEL